MFFQIATATAGAEGATGGSAFLLLAQLLPLAGILLVMYFLLLRPQRKKQKEETNMRKNLQIGDEVTTVGGITGIVVRKTEDTVVIETGLDKSKIRVKLWAIQSCETIHDSVD